MRRWIKERDKSGGGSSNFFKVEEGIGAGDKRGGLLNVKKSVRRLDKILPLLPTNVIKIVVKDNIKFSSRKSIKSPIGM